MKLLSSLLRIGSALPIFAMLLLVNLAQAAGSPAFNNLAGDASILRGLNASQGQSSLTTGPITAQAGENVTVAVYYHNTTEGSVAHNTTIKVNMPTTTTTEHDITASISADGVSPVTATVVNGQTVGVSTLVINSSAPTTMAMKPGSVRWYNEDPQSLTGPGAGLPNGQDGSTLITTGLNIGDIDGCFAHSGVVLFTVTLTGQNLPTISISKGVRPAGSTADFSSKITGIAPGKQVEYQVIITNTSTNGAVADKINLADVLPAGITYADPLTVTISHLAPSTLTGNQSQTVFSSNGSILDQELNPGDTVLLDFIANTAATITDQTCLTNTATASSSNAVNSPVQAAATVCFAVPKAPKASLSISKMVREAGTNNQYTTTNQVNPGDQVQYQITVTNVDGATTAQNVNVKDILPAQETFVGPISMTVDGTTSTVSNDMVGSNGTIVLPALKPQDSLQLTFVAKTDTTLANNACLVNTAVASSPNSTNTPQASATTCMTVAPTPAPTPTPPAAIPTELPRTGPEMSGLMFLGISTLGGGVGSYLKMKKKLKDSWRRIDIR
ncbi:isopeptide-forming domain-containing fimbrial protein [Patescibacteria group bacterium]|nr:isopeptide-forming domain-containing fimbrial protein [Patescibacteria group bacterium]